MHCVRYIKQIALFEQVYIYIYVFILSTFIFSVLYTYICTHTGYSCVCILSCRERETLKRKIVSNVSHKISRAFLMSYDIISRSVELNFFVLFHSRRTCARVANDFFFAVVAVVSSGVVAERVSGFIVKNKNRDFVSDVIGGYIPRAGLTLS